jgi:hypothetical protein
MPRSPPYGDQPINDEELTKQFRQSGENGCAELLRLLIQHHPDHERPCRGSARDDEPVRKRD